MPDPRYGRIDNVAGAASNLGLTFFDMCLFSHGVTELGCTGIQSSVRGKGESVPRRGVKLREELSAG